MTGAGILTDILALCDKNANDSGYRALALKWLDLVLKDISNRQSSYHWRFLEITDTLILVASQFNYALVTAFSTIDTTKVINVYDKINDYPLFFKPYERFRELVAKETNSSGDPRIFSIYSEDLLLWPVPDFTAVTGTASATVANKLSDAAATFITDGIEIGMKVTNTTDNTTALVTAIDSEILLTLDTDIMAAGEAYSISKCLSVDFVRTISDAADSATALLVPDKFKKVVYDGIMEFAYKHDRELGDPTSQNIIYENGLKRMIDDNSMMVAENVRPVSHRDRHLRGQQDVWFPLDNTNM